MIDDYVQIMFGQNARHVPAWMYVQDMGGGTVAFVGASRTDAHNPLRYGSERAHQFIAGEMIVRPHIVVATDALQGSGLAALATGDHDVARMLTQRECVVRTGHLPAGVVWPNT